GVPREHEVEVGLDVGAGVNHLARRRRNEGRAVDGPGDVQAVPAPSPEPAVDADHGHVPALVLLHADVAEADFGLAPDRPAPPPPPTWGPRVAPAWCSSPARVSRAAEPPAPPATAGSGR